MSNEIGTYANPLKIGEPLKQWTWPKEYADRKYLYVQEPNGVITKVYASYTDYCED